MKRLSRLKDVARGVAFATPYFPTKERWLRLLLAQEMRSEEAWELRLLGTAAQRMRVVPKTELGRGILRAGMYEKEVALAFQRLLSPGDLVLDVGANIGQYTLIASERIGPNGRVIALEPCPHVYRRLLEHIRINGISNAMAIDCAVGAETGEAQLVVLADSNDGMHHIAPTESNNPVGGETVTVPMRRLDDVVEENASGKSVDVIKIDVEGWEENVFEGCPRILGQSRPPTIFFESIEEHAGRFGQSAEGLRDKLSARGYQIFGARYPTWRLYAEIADPKPVNLVALHSSRPDHLERLHAAGWANAIDQRVLRALGRA